VDYENFDVVGFGSDGDSYWRLVELYERSLHVEYIDFSDENIEKLVLFSQQYKLEELFLLDCGIPDTSFLSKLQGLKSLRVSNPHTGGYFDLQGVAQLFHLERLVIFTNGISKIRRLEKLTCLQELNLAGNRIEKIENLDSLVQLRYLDLSDNRITIIENLEGLSNLIELDLIGNPIHSSEYKKLDESDYLPCLEKLDGKYFPLKSPVGKPPDYLGIYKK